MTLRIPSRRAISITFVQKQPRSSSTSGGKAQLSAAVRPSSPAASVSVEALASTVRLPLHSVGLRRLDHIDASGYWGAVQYDARARPGGQLPCIPVRRPRITTTGPTCTGTKGGVRQSFSHCFERYAVMSVMSIISVLSFSLAQENCCVITE